jgi:hypothetical protein
MKTEVIAFRQNINPSTSQTIIERVKANGRVAEIRVRFYPGQERELQIRPFVSLLNRLTEDVLTYPAGTEGYLSGDDDYLIFPVSVELRTDDNICVWANNVNATYVYTCVVDVVVQYYDDGNAV